MSDKMTRVLLSAGLATLACALLACSKSSTGGDVDEDVHPAPAAVTDLRITEATPQTVTLSWTAPVDDDDHGTVSAYDIRYTTSDPEPKDWDSAILVDGEPNPLPGGLTENFTVTGLTMGTEYFFALQCVGEQGACSEVSNIADTVLPIDFVVEFPDPNLEDVIREKLDQATGDIWYSSLCTMTDILADNGGISDLSGIEHCRNLTWVFLMGGEITDLTPLAGLTKIWMLNLIDNQISDVQPLSELTSIQQLHLGQNDIVDISPLSSLTSLTWLSLHENLINDITALTGMIELQYLSLENNQITDISPLIMNYGIGTGDEVWLAGNPLADPSQIQTLVDRGVTVHY